MLKEKKVRNWGTVYAEVESHQARMTPKMMMFLPVGGAQALGGQGAGRKLRQGRPPGGFSLEKGTHSSSSSGQFQHASFFMILAMQV
jgi:hypothetical protein